VEGVKYEEETLGHLHQLIYVSMKVCRPTLHAPFNPEADLLLLIESSRRLYGAFSQPRGRVKQNESCDCRVITLVLGPYES
jgi:hypothetical protein